MTCELGWSRTLSIVTQAPADSVPPKIAEISAAVAAHFGLTVADLKSECRIRSVAYPRQVGMYLARVETTHSYPAIAREFRRKDHTTVLFAHRKMRAILAGANNSELAVHIAAIRRIIADQSAGAMLKAQAERARKVAARTPAYAYEGVQ